MANEFVARKGLIVSGSTTMSGSLEVDGYVSASEFSGSFFGDGSGLTNVVAEITGTTTFSEQFVSQSSVLITHNLSTTSPIVQVYDENDEQIIPTKIKIQNDQQVLIEFPSEVSGKVVVAKGGHLFLENPAAQYSQEFVNQTSITVVHLLDTISPFVQIYDEENEQVIPQRIKAIDTSTVLVEFPTSTSGTIVVAKGGHIIDAANLSYVAQSFTNTSLVSVVHNFGTDAPIVQVYDSTGLQVIPQEIRIIDENSLEVEFPTNISGKVAVSRGGHIITTENGMSGSFTGSFTATQAILPNVTDQIDIGSPTNRFKDIYLSGSTIYLGNVTLSESEEGTLEITTANQVTVDIADIDLSPVNNKISNLEAESGSIRTTLNNYTSSADSRLGFLEIESGSIRTTFNNFTGSLGNIVTQNSSSITITGGSIDGTPIGGTTASTGAFTTLTADNIVAPNVADIDARVDQLENQAPAAQFSWDNTATTTPAAKPQVTPSDSLIQSIHDRMRGCLLLDDGTVNYYLNPNDWTKKAEGGNSDLTGADGMVMVEIPRFYVANESHGDFWIPKISASPRTGFDVHPAFIKDGVEVPYRYYSAYDACVFDGTNFIETNNDQNQSGRVNTATDKLVSVSGKAPMTGLTRDEFRLLAANRGDGWRIGDFALWSAIGLLLKVEAQTLDSQTEYGVGNTRHTLWPVGGGISGSRVCESGAGNSIGNGSGGSATGTLNIFNNGDFVKYRGIENFWGNCWNLTDGIVLYSEGNSAGNKVFAYWNNNTDDFADVATAAASTAIPTGYGLLGEVANTLTVNSFATEFSGDTVWSLVTTAFSSTGSHGTTDQYRTNNGWRVPRVGGDANTTASAGAFAFDAFNDSSARNRIFGARLAY
jgi:hypothetical protein